MITLAGCWRCLNCGESGTGTLAQVDKAADKHSRPVAKGGAGHGTVASAIPREGSK